MHRAFALPALASAWLIAVPLARATPPSAPQEASIPFVNHGGIYDWKVADRTTVYIQARDRKWYKATVAGTCINLDFVTTRLGFDAGPSDTLDRFSYIVAGRERCPIESLVPSGPPPKKPKKAK